MNRSTAVGLTAAAALASGAVLAAGGGAQSTEGQTIKLVTKNFHYGFVDNPPKIRGRSGTSGPGDMIALTGTATDPGGRRVGSLDVAVTVTKGGRSGWAVGQGAYKLADGEIHLMVRTSTREQDGRTEAGSVVGGTGAYAGARGTFTSVDRKGTAGGDPSDDTITLLP